MSAKTTYLLGLGLALATVLFLVLAIGALGIIGDGGRPDRIYAAVIAVLAIGSILVRLRPRGMAAVLVATAATQVLVTLLALMTGMGEDASVLDVLGINAMYAALFCASAWLFRRASEQPSAARRV